MDAKCVKCQELIRQKQQKLTCHACAIVTHRTCTDLTQDEYRSMNREKKLDSWLCDECDSRDNPVNSPGGVRNEMAMSAVESSVDGAMDQMQNTVSNETILQNTSTSAGSVENTCRVTDVHGTATQYTVPAASTVQNMLDKSDGAPNGVLTMPGVERVLPTFGSAQNVVLTESLQNVMSVSTHIQSAVSGSAVQDSLSAIGGVQSAVSTSGVHSSLSTTGGVQSAVSTSGVHSSLSTTGGVQSAVSTSGVHSSLSTTGGVQSAVSTSGVHSSLSTAGGVQSAVSTSGVSTIGGVQSAVSTCGVHSSLSTTGAVSTTGGQGSSSTCTTGEVQSVVPPSGVQGASESLRQKDAFTSAVQSVINRIHNVLSITQSVRQNTSQRQIQRVGTGEDTLQRQPAHNEQEMSVQKSCNKEKGTEKDNSGIQYSCCDVHGQVKPKSQASIRRDVLQQELSPFEEKIGDDLNGPRILLVAFRPRIDVFKFELKKDQLEMVTRSINSKKNNIQVRLRFCPFNIDKSVRQNITAEIKVNHRKMNNTLQNKVDLVSTSKQKVEFVDITDEIRKDLSENVVDIKYQAKENYYLSCELVKKNSVAELLELMTVNHPEHTEDLIRQKFKGDDDCEIATTNLKASLICPIGKMRLLKPCRSKHCTHIQCIDASTVLSLNQSNPKWKCQICQKPAQFDDLYIDGLFLKILASVPWDVVEVEFQKDGSWTHKKSSSQMSNVDDVDKENYCNLLDETIDKLDVIDLTETDDECSPVKRTPLKTNTALVNRIVKIVSQGNAQSKRLDSEGSTCSESSSRSGSSSSTSSVSSNNSTSNYSSLSSCSNRSTAIASTYNNDRSSYGSHKRNRHNYRPKGPYQASRHYNRPVNGYSSCFSRGQFCQTTIDRYTNSWRNVNSNYYSSVSTGGNSNYYNGFW